MTIKEYLEKHHVNDVLIHDKEGLPYAPLYKIIEGLVKEKLKDQKQICADNVKTFYFVDTDKVDEDSILNAPEPTL